MTFDKSVVVPLDPEATFALITQPDGFGAGWPSPPGWTLRPGGDYRWTVTPGHTAAGTIVDVEPGKRVMYTFGWEEDGDLPPGASTVTVTLTPVDGGTEVLTGPRRPDRASRRHTTPRGGTTSWTGWWMRAATATLDPTNGRRHPTRSTNFSAPRRHWRSCRVSCAGWIPIDLTKQTPCSEYTVAQLADHVTGSMTGSARLRGCADAGARSGCGAGNPGRRCGRCGA